MIRLFNTIKYLRPIQFYYRAFYLLRKKVRKTLGTVYSRSVPSKSIVLRLQGLPIVNDIKQGDVFTFLNISHRFDRNIDWNYAGYGKLWTYNLTYFDYLNQKDISDHEGLRLIYDFIERLDGVSDGMEPYPISLRGINWIKFLNRRNIRVQSIDDHLYAQYLILFDNLEYHLLGNHLLENGFSLLFGAYYFQDEMFYARATEILDVELEEQVLKDGGHFELSPMYHQIILSRVLDCIDLLSNNHWKEDELLENLYGKANKMLAWLHNMTFQNGDIPLFNDSAKGIAPTSFELSEYADLLDIKVDDIRLSDSGYRIRKTSSYEMIVDVGNIGPDYIPGHAHSDTFNFELHYHGNPYIVDTGISTYEKNQRRAIERSTASHNTVELAELDQSEVWGGFRVARRAFVTELKEGEDDLHVCAVHNGYKSRLDALHQRSFKYDKNRIVIKDQVISDNVIQAVSRIHFHPDIIVEEKGETIRCADLTIKISNGTYKIKHYQYAPKFNTLLDAKMVEITFNDNLEIEILL